MPLLTIIEGPGQDTTVEVTEEATLGRWRDCDVQIKDVESSRFHAEVFLADGQYRVKDLGSSNGTFVNDERITERALRHGDRIRIGAVVVQFTDEEAAAETEAEPAEPAAPETDGEPVQALGAALYRLVCGRRAAGTGPGARALALKASAPAPVARAVERMLSDSSVDRPPTLEDAVRTLEAGLDEAPPQPPAQPALARPRADEAKGVSPSVILNVVLTVLLLGAIVLLARLGGIWFIQQGG